MKFELKEDIALLYFDDGKANVVGHDFIDGVNDGLDRAIESARAVVIVGREGTFSAGFDLAEFKKGAEQTIALVSRGFEMLTRVYAHPQPVVAACTGHGVAAGAFLLLASDTRIGAEGNFRITLPETAIGMTLPSILHELARSRLSPRHLTAAVIQARVYTPTESVEAGFLDEVVAPDLVLNRAMSAAGQLAQLPGKVYGKNKLDCRAASLEVMRAGTGPSV